MGGRVVIIGGDSESCFLARYIAGFGADVFVVDPKMVFSENKLPPGRDLLMMTLASLPSVELRKETTIEEIGDDYVLLQKHGRFEKLNRVSSVVIGGRIANNELYEQLIEKLTSLEIYNIGDCVEPRDVYSASQEAAEVAELIRCRAEARLAARFPAHA
jgi:hypothetical protein